MYPLYVCVWDRARPRIQVYVYVYACVWACTDLREELPKPHVEVLLEEAIPLATRRAGQRHCRAHLVRGIGSGVRVWGWGEG